jgi:hypothetical protein
MFLFGYILRMEITEITIRRLQRTLNALARGTGLPPVKVDGRLDRRTLTSLARILAVRGGEGEAMLVRAMRALG